MGPINAEGLRFLDELGDKGNFFSGDHRESSFLFQRFSVLVQRFNMVAFRSTFAHLLHALDALVILKNSLSMPRLLYALRTSDCLDHPLLLKFDTTLRSSLSGILKIDFDDNQLLQATLPM